MNDSKKPVLVVDDEVEICLLLSGMLSKKGFDVTCKHSLQEARESLGQKAFALLFLDLNLPDGLGFQLVGSARQLYPDMKIVVISAYDGEAERKQAEKEKVNFFMPKPFNRENVWEAMRKVNIPIE